MKCYYHPEREIVATCTQCGKGLCKECASKWEPALCNECAHDLIEQKRAYLKRAISSGIVIFAIGTIIGLISFIQSGDIRMLGGGLIYGYFLAGVPNGWNILTRLQPSIFIVLPVVGWLFYFGFKFFLSLFVGVFAFPMNLYRFWKWNRDAAQMTGNAK